MIGAQKLSDSTSYLEAASSRGDTEAIRQTHPDMMAQYRILTEALDAHMDTGMNSNMNADIDADQGEMDDYEVLEFMPDQE